MLVLFLAGCLGSSCGVATFHWLRGPAYGLRPDWLLIWDLEHPTLHVLSSEELAQRLAMDSLSDRNVDAAFEGIVPWLISGNQEKSFYTAELWLADALLAHPGLKPAQKAELLSHLHSIYCDYYGQGRSGVVAWSCFYMLPTGISRPAIVIHCSRDLLEVDGRSVSKASTSEGYLNLQAAPNAQQLEGDLNVTSTARESIRLHLSMSWYDLQGHDEAGNALMGDPQLGVHVIEGDSGSRRMKDFLEEFGLQPLHQVEEVITLKAEDRWKSGPANGSTWSARGE